MKNILTSSFLTLIFISIFSCSKGEDKNEVNDSLSKARNYMEAAAILSNYNIDPDAIINIELSTPMNLNPDIKGGHVDMQALFNAPNGPTTSGDLTVQPFGTLPIEGSNLDVYRLNQSFSKDITSGASHYTLDYISSNSIYSSFNTNIFMDFDLIVNNNLQYLDGTNYLDNSQTLNLTWAPLQQSTSLVYVGFCADGQTCFYDEIPDTGNYTFNTNLYSGLNSGTKITLLLARGYQKCIENTGKDVCITNFSLANAGLVEVQ